MTGGAMREVIAEAMCTDQWGTKDYCCQGKGNVCAWRNKSAPAILAAITAAPAAARLAMARAITPDTHAVVPVEASDAELAALEDGCPPNRIQGFQYGDALVIRDVWQPPEQQEVWRGPADPRAEGERFSEGPQHDAFIRQCALERQRIARRAMIAAARKESERPFVHCKPGEECSDEGSQWCRCTKYPRKESDDGR